MLEGLERRETTSPNSSRRKAQSWAIALMQEALRFTASLHISPGSRLRSRISELTKTGDVRHCACQRSPRCHCGLARQSSPPRSLRRSPRRVGYPVRNSAVALSRYQAAARILPISGWVAQRLVSSGIKSENMTVVYEGVEIPRLPPPQVRREARALWGVTDDSPLLGCVGVLLPDKGQDLLIHALADLRNEFPQARLLLAGDGPDKSRLKQLATSLGITDAVIFAGFVKGMDPVYSALDVFLFPSRFEGLGTSLLSAMSYGLPSVAFSCCAFGEIIEDQKSGFLVETGDVTALRNAAATLLRDPTQAQQIGQAARTRIEEKFSAPQDGRSHDRSLSIPNPSTAKSLSSNYFREE